MKLRGKLRLKRNITSMSGVQSPFIPRSSTLALMARRTCNEDSLRETKPGNRAFFTRRVKLNTVVKIFSTCQVLSNIKAHQLIR